MSKKSNDINDIIESAYTVADYSHGGGYYDKSSEHDNNNKINTYSSIPYHRDHINTNTNTNTNNNNNIFLKYNQNGKNNSDSITNTTDNIDVKKLVLNDDNFPSLGGKHEPNINKSNKVENKLDFKKMVEKKPIIAITPPILNHQISSTNNRFKNNQYSLYNEIKERSEKIAQNKMIDDISSDDDYIADSVF